jgi:RNA polymerase sigma-70 factor, ECF subfamily
VTAGAGDVTALLLELGEGREAAREELIPLVYEELRRIAGRSFGRERSGHTLQPTALVHEVYQKLVDQQRVQWKNRNHFFAVAASLMRRILVDHARKRDAQRRGGGAERVALEEGNEVAAPGLDVDMLALDAALSELAAFDPGQARIVELRFFAGLSVVETAEALGSSRATVQRDWAMARAWLHRKLTAA